MRRVVSIIVVSALVLVAAGAVFAGGKKEEAAPEPGIRPAVTVEKPAPGYHEADITTRMVDTSEYQKPAPWTIGFSNASLSNSWRVSFVAHLRYAMDLAKEEGLVKDFYETNANDDAVKQIADIEDLMTRGVDLMIVSPATAEALTPIVERVMDRGIPVITVDRNIASDKYVSFVECSSTLMGRLQAEWLAAELGGEGNVIMLPGLAGATPAEDRLAAAEKVFEQFPGISILDTQYTSWSPVEGKRITQTLIQRFPQIDGVWADSGLQGSGAAEAFMEAGLEVPPITGEDFNRFLKMWKQNNLTAVGVTFSVRQGYEAVEVAKKVLQGEQVPHRVVVPNLVITDENLDDYVRMDMPDDYWSETMPEVAERMF
ncbi:MAG: ABC transporter substrate-binding protein [Spirochaetota bacterium]